MERSIINILIGSLGMFLVMFFLIVLIGCEITLKTEEGPNEEEITKDSTSVIKISEKESSLGDDFNASDWIIF